MRVGHHLPSGLFVSGRTVTRTLGLLTISLGVGRVVRCWHPNGAGITVYEELVRARVALEEIGRGDDTFLRVRVGLRKNSTPGRWIIPSM